MESLSFDRIQQTHRFDEAVNSKAFCSVKGALPFAVGFDDADNFVCCSLAKMPHLFVCGSSGSGKSVFLHSVVNSLAADNVDDVRIMLVDPKMVEFACYADNPKVSKPIVTDNDGFVRLLEETINETDKRYRLFVQEQVRDIKDYNNKHSGDKLPYIVVVVDELADLLLGCDNKNKVENLLLYNVQKCRAAGIHFVLSTSWVRSGLLSNTLLTNLPARAIFRVATKPDSVRFLTFGGAEKLYSGEMLFVQPSLSYPMHLKAFLPPVK